MKNYVQKGDFFTAAGVTPAMDSGEGRVIGGVFGVAMTDIADNGSGVLAIEGVYEFDKPNPDAGCTQFAPAYWDETNDEATSVSSGNTLIGVFAEAAAETAVKARVALGIGVSGKDEMVVSTRQSGAGSLATEAFFVAPVAMRVLKVSAVHSAAEASAATLTADVTKDTGTDAPGAGTTVLGSTKVNLKATANTVQSPALTSTVANVVLAAGDRLALKPSAGGTEIAGLVVTVHLAHA